MASDPKEDLPRKTEFYWASIAGAEPEPVELCTINGRRAVYTFGCGDPFFLDDKDTPVRLGTKRRVWGGIDPYFDPNTKAEPMDRPPLPTPSQVLRRKEERAYEKQRAYLAAHPHNWRGPR